MSLMIGALPSLRHLHDILCEPANHPPGGRCVAEKGLWYAGHPIPLAQFNVVRRAARPALGWAPQVESVVAALGEAPIRWDVTAPDRELEAALVRAGFSVGYTTETLWRRVAPPVAADPAFEVRAVTSLREAVAWHRVFCATRGHRVGAGAGAPWALLLDSPDHQLYVVCHGGVPCAVGALMLDRARGAGFLWGGGTLPAWRTRGAYRALLRARLLEAARVGVAWVAVRAAVHSSAPILTRLGFASVGERVAEWERPGTG